MKTPFVIALIMIASMATVASAAELQGLKDAGECKASIKKVELLNKLSDTSSLTPENAAQYFDVVNKRFVFCLTTSDSKYATISEPLVIKNNSQYPIIIYGLILNHTDPEIPLPPDTTLLSVAGSNIVLQNLTSKDPLKTAIIVTGSNNLIDSLRDASGKAVSQLSCAADMVIPAIVITGEGNQVQNVSLLGCKKGIAVSGDQNVISKMDIVSLPSSLGDMAVHSYGAKNTFKEMVIGNYTVGVQLIGLSDILMNSVIKPMAEESSHSSSPQDGSTVSGDPGLKSPGEVGVYVSEKSRLSGNTIEGYKTGVVVYGKEAVIEKNKALGGIETAVWITQDANPATVTQNTFVAKNTIAHEDPSIKPLLSMEWIGKRVEGDYVTKIVGKISKENESKVVELNLRKAAKDPSGFTQFCPVMIAKERIELKPADKAVVSKWIEVNDKYFVCEKVPDIEFKIDLKDKVRFVANAPTIQLMTDETDFETWPNVTTPGSFVAGTVGGTDLGDTGSQNNSGGNANAFSGSTPTFEAPAVIADGISGAGADSGAVGSVAGGKGCSLEARSFASLRMTNLLPFILLLGPLALLIPIRRRK